MKVIFQIAYKNIIGAGLRTWLNVGVLSFVFVIIITFYGLIEGWNKQSEQESISWEYAYGHLLHEDYDPIDPFTIEDSHGELSESHQTNLTPVFIRQATVYPQGRFKTILLNGIETDQTTIELPTETLDNSDYDIPVMIGVRMAEATDLNVGDDVLLRWRDKNGTYDAANITIAHIFNTNVASVDNGQIWVSIERLWEITEFEGEATYYIANKAYDHQNIEGWRFEDQDELLSEFRELIRIKNYSITFMYMILLIIALIAVFDTQVLSIFRRQKEIGTFISLGMTPMEVLRLFTVEGALYSVFGVLVGCVYGIPFFIFFHNTGFSMPDYALDMGVSVPSTIIPEFGVGLILVTGVVLIVSATVVSLIPAWKIAKMDPVSALRGKIQ